MANNQVSSHHSKHPIATHTKGSNRAIRITQMIENLIKEKSGSIVYQDMIKILEDVKDLYAIDKKHSMIKITQDYIKANNSLATASLKSMLRKLEKWDGNFDQKSKEPVYFTLWEYFFRSNFCKQASNLAAHNNPVLMKMISISYFDTNWIELYISIAKDKTKYAKYCDKYNQMESSSCGESMTRALIESIDYVNENHNNKTVNWGDLHKMAYPNIPFTRTPLRSIFDRYVTASGNYNTVNVASFKFFRFQEQMFNGLHSANLKFISELNGTVHYSLDTGNSEGILSGHYFDMNERHMKNELYRVDFPIKMDNGTKPDYEFISVKRNQTKGSEDL